MNQIPGYIVQHVSNGMFFIQSRYDNSDFMHICWIYQYFIALNACIQKMYVL